MVMMIMRGLRFQERDDTAIHRHFRLQLSAPMMNWVGAGDLPE
jgi:hypothetical protein